MGLVTRIPFAFGRRSCGFEADGLDELVEIIDDARRWMQAQATRHPAV